jgi:hypothetical protein
MASSAPPDVSSAKAASRTHPHPIDRERVQEQVLASDVGRAPPSRWAADRNSSVIVTYPWHVSARGGSPGACLSQTMKRPAWLRLRVSPGQSAHTSADTERGHPHTTSSSAQHDAGQTEPASATDQQRETPPTPHPAPSSAGSRRQTHRKTPHSSRSQLHSHLQRHTTEPHPPEPQEKLVVAHGTY